MEKLNDDQLIMMKAEQQKLMAARREISKTLREVARVISDTEEARALEADLSKLQSKHKTQVLKAAGIPTGESVGAPNAG